MKEAVKITGVVIPMGWNQLGQVISLGIAAVDETNYLVASEGASGELGKLLQREVTVWGRIKGEKPVQTIIAERVEMKKGKRGTKWSLVAVAMICAGLLVSGGIPSASAAQQDAAKTKVAAEKQATKAAPKAKKKAVKPNAKVKAAQIALTKAGFKCTADGIMGKKTKAAVKSFQKANKIKVTGKLDKATRAKLGV